MTRSGQRFTFRNKSWNGTLAPGASASFGFIGAGSGVAEPTARSTAPLRRRRARSANPRRSGRRRPSPAPLRRPSRLSWGASSGTVTGYRVYEGSTVRATVTGTTATIGGLGANTTHTLHGRRLQRASASRPRSAPVTAHHHRHRTAGPGRAGQRPGDRDDRQRDQPGVERSIRHGHRLPGVRGLHRAGDGHRHERDDRRPAGLRGAYLHGGRVQRRSASRLARPRPPAPPPAAPPARCPRTSSPATGTTSSTRPSSCGCATCRPRTTSWPSPSPRPPRSPAR